MDTEMQKGIKMQVKIKKENLYLSVSPRCGQAIASRGEYYYLNHVLHRHLLIVLPLLIAHQRQHRDGFLAPRHLLCQLYSTWAYTTVGTLQRTVVFNVLFNIIYTPSHSFANKQKPTNRSKPIFWRRSPLDVGKPSHLGRDPNKRKRKVGIGSS